MAKHVDLSIDFCGVKCENPFFLSSSPVGSSYEMCAKYYEAGGGGVVFKTVGTYIPDECSPRFDATQKEGTPFVGFKNMEQISDKPYDKNLEMMTQLKKDYPDKILIASIMGMDESDWTKLAKDAEQTGADIIECNFSCPQMAHEGMGSDVGASPELIDKFVRATIAGTDLPVMAKMTPNVEKMQVPARAAVKAGAHAISAINTIKAITGIDLERFVGLPVVNGKSSISGFSGASAKPIALRFLAEMAQDPELKGTPFSGMGGIETWEDAAEFIMLGASNLQFTTSIMQYGYRIVEDMISGLSLYLAEKGFNSLDELVGKALPNLIPADNVDRDFKIQVEIDLEKCVHCGRCYISCFDGAHQAIEWDEEKREPSVDYDKCVGCQLCLHVCPTNAIKPGPVLFKEHDQFGIGYYCKWDENASTKRDLMIGTYDRNEVITQ
ncbi:MAG: NAD-dependent dihydropyrimidine dehydrogenase subunit PreA [Spirochaetales bacterium]|nr:NAD-dependent dihydropyrimidine dehydrogenase subunit PreA [Spirochaetales bacterium]MCF7937942.1 NAD-dependent dihydropyrimidine dehydrogenase subunit PreA [Spirochaetales bacterium]